MEFSPKGQFPTLVCHVLLKVTNSTPENIHKLLFSDLGFTTSALKRYPKVYWIWNHRQWCLENMPEGPFDGEGTKSDGWKRSAWSQEMFIVEKMLDLDARNCG